MSDLMKLKIKDFFNGLVYSVMAGATMTIYSAFTSACGVGCIDWNATKNAAIGGGLLFIIQTYFTDSKGNFAGIGSNH